MVGVVGSAMALEALKLVTGVGTPLIGTLGYFDALSGTWEYIPLQPTGAQPTQPADAPDVREIPHTPRLSTSAPPRACPIRDPQFHAL